MWELSKWRIGQFVCMFIVVVGFGISCVYIHAKGTAFPDKGDCALPFEVANLTEASLEKSIISQWRWTYEDESEGLKIRAKCPSLHQDADVFHNDKLIGRTQGQIFNFEGSFDLLDCNGKKFGRWSAESWEDALVNFYTFSVNSFLEKDGEIIGWIEGENFMSDNIVIRAADDAGTVVASMSRDIISLTWTWEIHRHHPMHPAADWRFILGIIGKESFAEDSDENCICNQYFYHLGYTLIAVICLIFCCGLYACFLHGGTFVCDACLSTMECCENVCELCCNKDTSTDNGSQNHGECSIDMTNIGTTNVDTTPRPEIPLN